MKNYRQLRATVQRLRRRNKVANSAASYEVFNCTSEGGTSEGGTQGGTSEGGTQGGQYQQCRTAQMAAQLADHLCCTTGVAQHVWAPAEPPSQQHVYTVAPSAAPSAAPRVTNNIPRKSTSMKRQAYYETDESVAVELVDHINNTEPLYRNKIYIEEGLSNKMASGRFDPSRAAQAYMHLLKQAAESYIREFADPASSWHEMFPMAIRRIAAQMLFEQFEAEVDVNPQDFAGRMPKKHLPEWEKRYNRDAQARSHNYQENPIMTQKRQSRRTSRPSRNARRRLTARVERARTRETRRDNQERQDARRDDRPEPRRRAARPAGRPVSRRAARYQPSKADRLTRRVASLEGLLRQAEQELHRAEDRGSERRPVRRAAASPRNLRSRRARVAAIRDRLARETDAQRQPRRPRRASVRRPDRRVSRRVASQARRQTRRTAAAPPRVIRRKQDGKIYIRQD